MKDMDVVTSTDMRRDETFTAITLRVELDTSALGKDAMQVIQSLSDKTPCTRAEAPTPDTLEFLAHNLRDGEPENVAKSRRGLLSA